MLRKVLKALLVLLVLLIGAAVYAWRDRPDLTAYAALVAPPANGAPGVTATFLGVSTLLVSDGETHLMTDGFFSRPPLWQVLAGEVAPDEARIAAELRRAGVQRLDALVALHSHYDHAMDSPEVAERTGAVLIGSRSSANIARGWGLPASQIVVAESGVPLTFGAFAVTLIESRHLPHGFAEGTIDQPLVPPAAALDYRQGTTWVVHIAHPLGSLAIVGSAGFVEGALSPYRSDVVLLGVGGLSKMTAEYRETYLDETLGHLRPRRLMPIHYDDFTRPLSEPLVAAPRLADDLDQTFGELRARADADGSSFAFLPFAEATLLFPAP